MVPMLRFGSGWHDVEAQVPAITRNKLNSSRFVLCTDDSHSQTLVDEGHMDRVLRHAISVGIPPMTALQMATLNTAEYFGVSRSMGLIAPGRYAEVLLVKDLNNFHADLVISKGQILAENGKLLIDLPTVEYPVWALNSVHFPEPVVPADFCVKVPEGVNPAKAIANVIGVIEDQAPTKHLRIPVKVEGCEVKADPATDLAKIALLERHHNTGRVQVGFVNGFGFNVPCAVASTVAHDCHHMIVVGTDDDSMALAANALAEMGGGQIVVKGKEVIGKVDLKIGGLMSNEKATVVASKASTVLNGFKECGCMLDNPNMQLSLLALAVIPELRISDLGLVDVTTFCFIPVLESR
jgi:adenine deaminase